MAAGLQPEILVSWKTETKWKRPRRGQAKCIIALGEVGPIGAFLVELFPTKVRYSGVSVAMQIGNGWIGGFAPFFATMLVVSSGNIFAGLWYTVVVAAVTFIIGVLFIRDTRHNDINQ
ncbi:MAG: hypothetical protein J0G33_06220 [Afipia felis]|nr:hypothetical protein [Afipia felis]